MPISSDGGRSTTGGRADIASLQQLLEESRRLREEMHQAQEQQQFRSRWTVAFMGIMAAAVIALATLVIQNREISESNREIAAQIADCSTQGGACWEESRQRSRGNVLAILNTTIFVAECLQQYPDIPRLREELEACVRREIDTGRQPVPVPSPTTPVPSPAASR